MDTAVKIIVGLVFGVLVMFGEPTDNRELIAGLEVISGLEVIDERFVVVPEERINPKENVQILKMVYEEKDKVLYLVRQIGADPLFLSPVDPYMGCMVVFEKEKDQFFNPCHGQRYDRTGKMLSGPAIRDLDRYTWEFHDGAFWVDLTSLI